MPNAIERDVYVLRNTLKNPISYVRGTDLLPIIFHFRDFTIPSGATATAFTAKPDGNAVYGSATISENDVTVDVQQQMFIVLGLSMLQVEIKSGEETLATFVQPVMVEPNLKAGDFPPSTTDINFLDKVIEQAQEAVDNANQAVEDANTAISGANTAASSANQAAQNANQAAEDLQDKVDAGDFTASVQVGTTTTLEPDQDATVSNSGTNKDAVLNFGIPKGDPGTAATIQVGTTQTVQPEENAEVTNSGTANAAVLDFKIPRGEDGMTDLTAEYKDASEYTCQPTSNAPVVVKQVDGKTEQVVTTGAQLFDGNYKGGYIDDNGIVVRYSDKPTTYYLIVIPCEENTEYTLSTETAQNRFYIGYSAENIEEGTHLQGVIAGNGQTKMTITTGTNAKYIRAYVFNTTIDQGKEVPRFMLNSGSEALPWEPYTGGSPAPSPDYPQVIEGVGGMGYFDGEWKQGNISSTGTIGTETTGITSANAIPCKQNDNIAVTYADSIDVIAVAFYNASGAHISTSTSGNSVDTFTATAPANAASFKVNLRVVSGSTITPNGAKYCTVTINGEYQTGMEVHGAQLFDANEFKTYSFNNATVTNNGDGSFTISGSGSLSGAYLMINTYSHDETLKMIKSGTLNLSCGFQTCPYVEVYLSTSNGNKNYLKNSTDGFSSTEIENETLNDETCKLVVRFYGQAGDTIIPGTIRPMLYQFGDGTYQPYHHTALSIPLTAPLYESDKICYVKPGESYVNSDGETVVADGVLYGCYRENVAVVFDGSEDESLGKNSGGDNLFSCTITNKVGSSNGGEQYLKCNKLTTAITNLSVLDMPDNSIKESGTMGSNVVFFNISEAGTTVESLRTWLSTNPLTVVYRLAQPYFEPFPDQAPFYTLRTDDTLTYIYSSDPIEPNVTVEVAKNSTGGYLLESYATAQKNAISEANSQSRISAIEQQLVNQVTTPTE